MRLGTLLRTLVLGAALALGGAPTGALAEPARIERCVRGPEAQPRRLAAPVPLHTGPKRAPLPSRPLRAASPLLAHAAWKVAAPAVPRFLALRALLR